MFELLFDVLHVRNLACLKRFQRPAHISISIAHVLTDRPDQITPNQTAFLSKGNPVPEAPRRATTCYSFEFIKRANKMSTQVNISCQIIFWWHKPKKDWPSNISNSISEVRLKKPKAEFTSQHVFKHPSLNIWIIVSKYINNGSLDRHANRPSVNRCFCTSLLIHDHGRPCARLTYFIHIWENNFYSFWFGHN